MKHLIHSNHSWKTFKTFVFFAFFASCFMFYTPLTHAINMESPRFRIQFGNINEMSGTKNSEGYNLSDTVGQLAAGSFASKGYLVKAGFQYIHSIIPFQFTVTSTSLDFGDITPNNFSTAKTDLVVAFGSAGSYQVTALEKGPLRTQSNNIIPDTLCNRGQETCTQFQARPWTKLNAYGFGYNMQGDDTPVDFASSIFYRPFADLNSHEEPVIVMSSDNVGRNRQATMNFKLNIPQDQPAGTYQTIISYVATPGF